MLEYEMVFGLGFCTAGLLALACLPAVWRRALRLTNYRLRQLVPLSSDEISAEQAGIRARAAVEQRRLEERLAEEAERRSELMAELGRRDATLAAMTEASARAAAAHAETSARDAAVIAGLEAGLGATRDEAQGLTAQMAAANVAMHELDGLSDRRRREAAEARKAAQDLRGQINEDRASIAAFETRVLGLETRVADLRLALDKVTADLRRSEAEERQASAQRDEARRDIRALIEKRDALGISVERLDAELARTRERAEAAERRAEGAVALSEAATTDGAIVDLSARRGTVANAEGAPGRSSVVDGEAGLEALRQAIRQVADDVLKLTGSAPPGRR